MKTKIRLFIIILYVTAFAQIFLGILKPWINLETFVVLVTDLVISYLGISTLRLKPVRFLFSLILLLIISTINYLHEMDGSVISHLNGLREITAIIFAFVFVDRVFSSKYRTYCNSQFKTFVRLFLWVQIPVCIFQFAKFGASDAVSGTLLPGNTGVLTLAIFILVFYQMINYLESHPQTTLLKTFFIHSYLFIPVFLNETKITFILIVLFFVCQLTWRRMSSLFSTLGACIIFVSAFAISYSDQGKKYQNPLQQFTQKTYLEKYLNADAHKGADVPRVTKVKLALNLLASDNVALVFGKEYGAFKGGNVLAPTPFAYSYSWLLKGSRPTSFYLLITGGLTLIAGVVFFLCNELFRRPHLKFRNYSSRFVLFLTGVLLLILLYNDAFRTQLFILVFSYCLYFSKYYRQPWRAQEKSFAY